MTGGLKVPFQICRKAFFAPDCLVGAFNYRPLTQRQTATRPVPKERLAAAKIALQFPHSREVRVKLAKRATRHLASYSALQIYLHQVHGSF